MNIKKIILVLLFTSILLMGTTLIIEAVTLPSVVGPEVTLEVSEPVLITSAGQSADAMILKTVAKKVELEYKFNALAKEEDLQGVKSIIVVMGASSKGLGAAGLDIDKEIKRVKEFLEETKKDESIIIFAIHIGGKARRGVGSNSIIELVVPYADYIIVTEAGNEDHFFEEACKKNEKPLMIITKMADIIKAMDDIFHSGNN